MPRRAQLHKRPIEVEVGLELNERVAIWESQCPEGRSCIKDNSNTKKIKLYSQLTVAMPRRAQLHKRHKTNGYWAIPQPVESQCPEGRSCIKDFIVTCNVEKGGTITSQCPEGRSCIKDRQSSNKKIASDIISRNAPKGAAA